MQWESFPNGNPKQEGSYIVSVKVPYSFGERIFNDSAYYESKSNKWYKYDAFNDKPNLEEEITQYIVGWIDDIGSYLGLVVKK